MQNPLVERVMADLADYVERRGIRLSWVAEAIFRDTEIIASGFGVYPFGESYLAGILGRYPPLQDTLIGGAQSVSRVVKAIEKHLSNDSPSSTPFLNDRTPYSSRKHRGGSPRTRMIDLAILIARENNRIEVWGADVVEAMLRSHDEAFPAGENGTWADQRLHTEYNSLAHIIGEYLPELDVSFDTVRVAIAAHPAANFPNDPFGSAPPEIHSGLRLFLEDHPNFERNCFLMMSFNPSPFHGQVLEAAREALREQGFNPLRADDRAYSDQLLSNIRIYLHGCAFGVAVFERIESNDFNPNVSLEVGYYLGLGRPVCLLKERTLPRLPSDLAGSLYREFDLQRADVTIRAELARWLQDKRLTRPIDTGKDALQARSTTGRKRTKK
jgi:hypothetical protein